MKYLGKKVYFVTTQGEVKEYTVVNPANMSSARDCDLLIKDERGFVSSANSSHYFLDKKKALEDAKLLHTNWYNTALSNVNYEREVLNKINDQLNQL